MVGYVSFLCSIDFLTDNFCVPSAHLECRDKSSTVLRSPYASSDDLE